MRNSAGYCHIVDGQVSEILKLGESYVMQQDELGGLPVMVSHLSKACLRACRFSCAFAL